MQDSLEDYIRISRNSKAAPPNINKVTDAQITLQRKKECDVQAMKIIEFSIEGKLRPEVLQKCLPFINQSHYQDIVEERAIINLCGYPICGKNIPEMPKKQFHISTRSNKVYDIKDRKNYCSNFCYKASLHVKSQIDDSPLWLRRSWDNQEYHFLESSDGGLPGELVDRGLVKPASEPEFTSVSIFTEASLSDLVENESGKEKTQKRAGFKKASTILKSTMQTINENAEQVEEEEKDVTKHADIKNNTHLIKKYHIKKFDHINCKSTLAVIDEKEEKVEGKRDDSEGDIKSEKTTNVKKIIESSSRPGSKKNKKKYTQKIEIESIIQKAVKDWLTLETYIFIHGELKVKEVLNEKKLSDYFEELNITNLQRHQQKKYMDICRRLQMQEMADEKFDNSVIGNTKLQPVPDYKKLKDESKDLDIKVKCFYSGVLHEKEDTNFPTKINNSNETSESDGPPAVLPLVDVNSQNALRRKIFLTSINKSMQQLLQLLRVTHYTSILSDLQSLVKTFKLSADNIVFKPIVWNFMAIVLLYILSLRDNHIRSLLEEQQEIIHLQLSSLPNNIKLINEITFHLQNIDVFVENYISSR